MKVSFNPNVTSFSQNIQQQQIQPPYNPVTENIYEKPVKPAKKPSKFINGISKIAKFFTSLNEMIKATVKALFYGAIAMGMSIAGFWTFGVLPKIFKKGSGLTFKEAFKHPMKNMSKTGKVFTGVATTGVVAYHVIKGILNMNQRTANVDHKLKTGHRVD